MSRPLRFQRAGLVYHVMTRGNNKMPIFLDDLDYARFIAIVREARERFELDVWLYCAMPNHYHLVLRTRRANLSLAIAHVNGTYAQWWNKRHARRGHVYQGRFKAQVVEACTYLLRLCRYVLMNPVRSQLVATPGAWPWSSYHALTAPADDSVDVETLLHAIDPDRRLSRLRLREFVDQPVEDEIAFLVRTDQRVIGGAEFTEQFATQATEAPREVPKRERRTGTTPLAALLADALERGAGLHAGVVDAFAGSYTVAEIARCAGLSERVVQRLLDGAAELEGDSAGIAT